MGGCCLKNARVLVKGNTFFDNGYSGISTYNGGHIKVDSNHFEKHNHALHLDYAGKKNRKIILENNNFINSSEYAVKSTTKSSIIAKNNWWETTDQMEMQMAIYDYYDDTQYGKVDTQPSAKKVDLQLKPLVSQDQFDLISSKPGGAQAQLDNYLITLNWKELKDVPVAGYKVFVSKRQAPTDFISVIDTHKEIETTFEVDPPSGKIEKTQFNLETFGGGITTTQYARTSQEYVFRVAAYDGKGHLSLFSDPCSVTVQRTNKNNQ